MSNVYLTKIRSRSPRNHFCFLQIHKKITLSDTWFTQQHSQSPSDYQLNNASQYLNIEKKRRWRVEVGRNSDWNENPKNRCLGSGKNKRVEDVAPLHICIWLLLERSLHAFSYLPPTPHYVLVLLFFIFIFLFTS